MHVTYNLSDLERAPREPFDFGGFSPVRVALSYGQSIAFRKEDRWEGRLDFRPPLGTSEVDIVFDVDTTEYDELFASLLASPD